MEVTREAVGTTCIIMKTSVSWAGMQTLWHERRIAHFSTLSKARLRSV